MTINRGELAVLPQTNSPLFKLPGELRNYIYDLSLTPFGSIVNPCWDKTIRHEHQQVPSLGIALLRTCRALYLELGNSILLEKGDYVFTRVTYIQAFFARLSLAQASYVRHITIDLREAASGDVTSQTERSMTIANEWIHYFCCTQGAHMMGAWCADLCTLKSDIPHLRSLCIDLTTWQPSHAGSRMGGWRYLQKLLPETQGLDSFTLKGKRLDSSSWSSQPVPWSLGLWFSPVFERDESALVDLIAQTVRLANEEEVRLVEWHTMDCVTLLTVRVEKARKVCPSISCVIPLLQDGMMLWDEFLEFKNEQVEFTKRRKASVPVGDTIWTGAPVIQV
ncbi:hypothetical protein AUEXF2481DRAFT_26767 [Aureobasidium subglaciale EXF-2481]|uniref:Uncharacterized protein n=1 Tax=Aureobasidium subglaciale (strain EXF-2481) TaxID=1043005 RepID=A0A074ZIK4_AURSE|nr:uncharacterized protein AUEXF2481DRAFT_26767 [Aureobasidium subglaciale EXF-2481]KEQ98386.1 hypothetical protein AUEXF2481DRAFT_26767 [Aureobasidium subglaciale EXF-2481]